MTKSKPMHVGLWSFFNFLRLHKLRVIGVVVLFVIANVPLSLIPIFIGKLTGALAADPVQGHQAVVYTWTLIGLSTAHDLIWRIGELAHVRYMRPISYLYENHLFERIIRQPYPYFVDKFTGKLSSYITTISQEMRDFMDNLSYNYTSQIVNVIALSIVLASVNWQTGAIFIGGLLIMLVVGKYSIRNSNRYESRAADIQSTKNGKLIDSIANFVNIKAFRKESLETSMIAAEQTKTIKAARTSFLWSLWFWTTMSVMVRNVIWPATIGLNVYLFLHGEINISQLATLLSAILLFSTTIWDLVWLTSQFNLKLARIDEAHKYLFGLTILRSFNLPTGDGSRPPFRQSLEVHKLHFAYPDKPDSAVLHDVSLRLRKGEKLGVVGRSGSGKTTITKLLLGYYPTSDGTLSLDGVAISNSALASLISYVPQDTTLFHRTIANNIAYASDDTVTQDDIVRAAKRAHADEFITTITDGYDALVGERGVKLSAGQRQRIAIARAFLDDKPILILDEATSALDSESEVLVQQALEALWHDKTVIAIAHRLSTLRHMDRIIVIDKGRIVEEGSHQALIEKKGLYAEFWSHQSGGFIEE